MSRRIQLLAVVLAVLSQAARANPDLAQGPDRTAVLRTGPAASFAGGTSLPARVLHFPAEQSIGEIVLIDEDYVVPEISREFHPGYVFAPAQYLGPARGDVHIPAGKCVCLHLGGKGVTRRQCFECLESLGPDDVQDLDFLQPLQVDDAFLPYVARLTGITHFCPVSARFTGKGWTTLQTLPGLVHICTPYGLTDAEMAGIATLQTVNEMEIVATRLTDAGLASIAKLHNLQVLHLEGTAMMTDEGLKTLATLPILRHLRLSGPFTDKGVAYLAGLPSLKALWLEAPKATEEGLRLLSQSKTLERLCVPWLDQITAQSVTYLQAMPQLKALGVGNARGSNAGVARLAALTNLEVLAIKGGSDLTDDALKPLAGMPKLRALEIYHSRITEQGLTCLYPCKRLDSIQIKSTAPVSEQAVTRLKTELPHLQTVDISQSESQRRMARPVAMRRR